MRYPGTITVPEEAFQKVLEFAARSFKLHGFRNIVLLGDHGGNAGRAEGGGGAAQPRVGGAPACGCTRSRSITGPAEIELPRLLKARGYRDAELGRHAGLTDTALMLAIDPRLVRADRLRPGSPGDAGGRRPDPRHRRAGPARASS